MFRENCQNIVWRANNQHFFYLFKVLSTTAQNVTVADNIQFLALDGNVPNVSATIYAVFGKYLLDVLWGQPFKLIQVVSTSEVYQYWQNDLDFIFLTCCRASEVRK